MKKQIPKTNMPDDILETSRARALELFRAAVGPTKDSWSAQALVELAVYVTMLVENTALVNPDAVSKAAQYYPFFPVLLASKDGRDTKQKLERVESLPVGEARPFKRLRGQARNDNLRDWIEGRYDQFWQIRQGRNIHESRQQFVNEISQLPKLNNQSVRTWADMMARYALEGPGGEQWPAAFGIDLSKETERRRRRKVATFRKRFDSSKQLNGNPGEWTLRQTEAGMMMGFVVRDRRGNEGAVLDHAEATGFQCGQKEISNVLPTDADKVNALTDVIEKRIQSILK